MLLGLFPHHRIYHIFAELTNTLIRVIKFNQFQMSGTTIMYMIL